MSTINNGGPAFPIPPCGTGDPRDGMSCGSDGMTLRDYFAAHAVTGILSNSALTDGQQTSWVVAYATDIADAMLKAREGK